MCTNNIYTFFLLKIRSLFSKIYTFIYFGVRELAKSHAMPCVPYMPAWFTCPRAKSVPTSHFLCANVPINVLMCQWGKSMPIFQLGVPTCQKACHFFNFAYQTVCQFLNYFSKELCFLIYLKIYTLYLIYFIHFVYFKYIPNIYSFYEYIFLT